MYTASCISPLRPTSIKASRLWATEPGSVTLPEISLWHPGYRIYLIKRLMGNAKNLINALASNRINTMFPNLLDSFRSISASLANLNG